MDSPKFTERRRSNLTSHRYGLWIIGGGVLAWLLLWGTVALIAWLVQL